MALVFIIYFFCLMEGSDNMIFYFFFAEGTITVPD